LSGAEVGFVALRATHTCFLKLNRRRPNAFSLTRRDLPVIHRIGPFPVVMEFKPGSRPRQAAMPIPVTCADLVVDGTAQSVIRWIEQLPCTSAGKQRYGTESIQLMQSILPNLSIAPAQPV
jgi:hypothetical protein